MSLYDPTTGTPANRQRFANNQIPANRFHPIAQKLIPLIPRPNQPGLVNNLIVNTRFRYNGYGYDGRVDHVLSERTRAFAKFNYSDYKVVQEAALGNVVGESTVSVNGLDMTTLTDQSLGIQNPNPDAIDSGHGTRERLGDAGNGHARGLPADHRR